MKKYKLSAILILFIVAQFAGFLFSQNDNDDITLGKYRKFHSSVLGEDRTIYVHLPDGYDSSSLSYPVIYLLYCNSVELYFASAVSSMYPLQDRGEIPEFILIGVGDTGQRYRDYLPVPHQNGPGLADNFAKFFKEELIPFVDKNYRTKNYRIVAGPQSASVFGVYSLLKYPELFNAAIVSNPFNPYYKSAGVLNDLTLKNLQSLNPPNKFLFISYYSNEKDSFDDLARFVKTVDSAKPGKFRYHVNKSNDSGFYEDIFLKDALRMLFDKFALPDVSKMKSLDEFKAHYKQASEYYGFQMDIPSLIITFKVEELINARRFDEASDLLDYALNANPKDTNSLFRKAMLCTSLGDLDSAVTYYEKAHEILPNEDVINRRLAYVKKQIAGSAAYKIEKAVNSSGVEQGVKVYTDLTKQKPEGVYFDEREFNALGYRFLSRNMLNAALEVFKMNTELYPESANAFDSLGEIYMIKGDKASALKFYKKSLELNPENENAAKKIKELKQIKD